MDGTLTSITTPDQSGPEINGNESVLYIHQSWNFTYIQDTH